MSNHNVNISQGRIALISSCDPMIKIYSLKKETVENIIPALQNRNLGNVSLEVRKFNMYELAYLQYEDSKENISTSSDRIPFTINHSNGKIYLTDKNGVLFIIGGN